VLIAASARFCKCVNGERLTDVRNVDFKAKAEIPEIFQEQQSGIEFGPKRGESGHLSDFGLHHARFRESVRARRCDEKLPRFARGIVTESSRPRSNVLSELKEPGVQKGKRATRISGSRAESRKLWEASC